MIIPDLPRTESREGRISIPNEPGVWSSLGSLDDLAASLEIKSGPTDLNTMKSVPHMWGRVKVFEAAFADADHPAHESAISHWRGLLALLALRREEEFSIRTQPLDLEKEDRSGPAGRFVELAFAERPARTLDVALNWNCLTLLYATSATAGGNDTLLGLISPSTLVVPARDYHGPDTMAQSWARGRIRDPLLDDSDALSPDQLAICEAYIRGLHGAVKSASSSDKALSDRVVRELDRFANELKKAEGGVALSQPMQQQGGTLVVDAPSNSVYSALNHCWSRGEIAGMVTDSLIVPEPEATLEQVFSGAILADPRLAETLGRPRDRVSIFNARMLSEIEKLEAAQREADEIENGFLILRPEDLFADAFVPLNELEAPAHKGLLKSSLIPLTPAALLIAPIDRLLQQLNVFEEEPGRFSLQLALKIRKRDGSEFEHTVIREYVRPGVRARTPNAGVVLEAEDEAPADMPLTFAAWPNFILPGWKWNYLMAHSQILDSAVLTTGTSGSILARDLSRHSKPADRRARLKAWGSSDGPWQAGMDIVKDDSEASWFETLDVRAPRPPERLYSKKLQRSDFAFEAGLFAIRPSAAKLDGSEPVYAGIGVLEAAERKSPSSSTKAEIAVDFGTTNTTVYQRIAGGSPSGMVFKSRLRRFNATDTDVAETDYVSFLPSNSIRQPFATVAQHREPEIGAVSADELFSSAGDPILWRDYAFFDTSVVHMMRAIFEPASGRLEFDLKWSEDPEIRALVQRYLGHIAVLSLAELADQKVSPSNIHWNFSYPMSMKRNGADFQALIKDVIPKISNVPDKQVNFRTESDAALVYFQENRPKTAGAMIVLDIGGGTTDIAIATGHPLWRHSVRLAGGDLMINFLLRNRSFVELLQLDSVGQIFTDPEHVTQFMKGKRGAQASPDERDMANAIINSEVFREAFERRLPYISGTEEFELLRSGAFLMLGGLLYYTGLQVRALLAAGEVPENKIAELDDIRICFAGRGATLYKQLFDRSGQDPAFNATLRLLTLGMDREAARLDLPDFSDEPKHEAAEGMLRGDDRSEGDRKPISKLSRVAGTGIDYSIGGGEIQSLTAEKPLSQLRDCMIEHVKVENGDGPGFDDFLERLRAEAGLEIDITGIREAIERAAKNQVSDAAKLASDGGLDSVNPPFIELLKQTLALLYAREDGVSARWIS